MRDRHLHWEGCYNARDVGGLRTVDGRRTRWGALVRSDSLDHLTPAGWAAVRDHGIRTIVDLRNEHERAVEGPARPPDLAVTHVPLHDLDDRDLWEYSAAHGLDGSPLYYRRFLERQPKRAAAALAAVAQAQHGGVVVHCGIGRDRTGLVTMLVLALAGVTPEDIAADYELSGERLRALWEAAGEPDPTSVIEARLRRHDTTAREAILQLLGSLDVHTYLKDAGLGDDDIAALRQRLLQPGD